MMLNRFTSRVAGFWLLLGLLMLSAQPAHAQRGITGSRSGGDAYAQPNAPTGSLNACRAGPESGPIKMKDTIGYADDCRGLLASAWSQASEMLAVDNLADAWWGARTWDLYRDSTLRTPGSNNALFDARAVDSRDIDSTSGQPFFGPSGSMQFHANNPGLQFVLVLSGEFGNTGAARQGWSAYYLFDDISIFYDDPAIKPFGADGLLRFRIMDPSMNMTIDQVSMYVATLSQVPEPATLWLLMAAAGLAMGLTGRGGKVLLRRKR